MASLLIFSVILTGVVSAPSVHETNSWKVIGGTVAPNGAYPYQISLRDKWNAHYCGGSIIKPTIILTAAHCATGTSASSVSVVVGSNKLNEGGKKYAVRDIRSHEKYNPFTIENDIAILKLSSAIDYTDLVQPVVLETTEVKQNTNAVLTGWGLANYPGSNPNDLQQINLKTISIEQCKSKHSKPVFNSQICTFTTSGEGACQGDSGGPLVADGRQIGIVSWGKPCAVGYPDVFTKVSDFGTWIKINSY